MRTLVNSLLCGVVSLSGCRARHTGPKLIEADGVRYAACSGAIWIQNPHEPKDNAPATYRVFFKDARGQRRELTGVRVLFAKDLPDNAPECAAPR